MYKCNYCGYIGDMESKEGIPICPDCGQDDTEEYLAHLIERNDA